MDELQMFGIEEPMCIKNSRGVQVVYVRFALMQDSNSGSVCYVNEDGNTVIVSIHFFMRWRIPC